MEDGGRVAAAEAARVAAEAAAAAQAAAQAQAQAAQAAAALEKTEEEVVALKAQLARLKRLVSQETKKGEEVDEALGEAEKAPAADPEEQRKVLAEHRSTGRPRGGGRACNVREAADDLTRLFWSGIVVSRGGRRGAQRARGHTPL